MSNLDYHMTLTLLFEKKCFGPGPMKLLQGVEETGSLHQSAASMGMAYSKAWTVIKELEKLWGFSLIASHSGGSKGGGSVLTPKGKMLLEQYRKMLSEVEEYAQKSFDKHFDEDFLHRIKE